jgi:poly-gamma-glutamate synthesis protein (capsule biosynthesis protein)
VAVRNTRKSLGAAFAVLALCALVVSLSGQALATTTSTSIAEAPVNITIAAVGDVIPHARILSAARDRHTDTYDFWPMFGPIAPYLAGADYAIANLETPLAGPETGYTGYPSFNAPIELAHALTLSGVDLCATANNHCLDRGWPGIVGTLDRLDQAGLAHMGTYRSPIEKSTPLVVDIQGVRVGFLNYTAGVNGRLSPSPAQQGCAVNVLDVDAMAMDALAARMWGADIVIAIVHDGNEYQRQPSTRQVAVSQGRADFAGLLSRGVDVIIGHHPHVVQPIVRVAAEPGRKVKDAYVAYSVGNFISNQPWRYTDSGIIAYVNIEKRGLYASVTGISYLPVYVQHSTRSYPETYRVMPVLPGLEPTTDIPLTRRDKSRMDQIWKELNPWLYLPEDNIGPVDLAAIGL